MLITAIWASTDGLTEIRYAKSFRIKVDSSDICCRYQKRARVDETSPTAQLLPQTESKLCKRAIELNFANFRSIEISWHWSAPEIMRRGLSHANPLDSDSIRVNLPNDYPIRCWSFHSIGVCWGFFFFTVENISYNSLIHDEWLPKVNFTSFNRRKGNQNKNGWYYDKNKPNKTNKAKQKEK